MDTVNEQLKARQRALDAEEKKGTAEEAARHASSKLYMEDYHKRLKAKRDAEQAERDAAREQELAPTKRREMLQWLVDHPDQGESDFERIWPAKRELLKIGDRDDLIQREIAAQRRRY